MFNKIPFALVILILAITACSPVASNSESVLEKPAEDLTGVTPEPTMEKSSESMQESTSEVMAEQVATSPESMNEETMDEPQWFNIPLTNVHNNEMFTITDFKGKVILVETLAMWCSNCKKQQTEVKALHEALGPDHQLISIGLDIDPNENANDLKAYTENNGFDWIYAVAPAELSREIANLYGDQFLNPPSTPILIIDRKGQVHPLPFGIKSAQDLMRYIEPFLVETM